MLGLHFAMIPSIPFSFCESKKIHFTFLDVTANLNSANGSHDLVQFCPSLQNGLVGQIRAIGPKQINQGTDYRSGRSLQQWA
jgi:hypothetical protein